MPFVESSDLDGEVAEGGGDAELDLLVRRGGDLAGEEVLVGAGALAAGAGVADAHPASVFGAETGGLGLDEQGLAAVGDPDAGVGPGLGEKDLALAGLADGDEGGRDEALDMQPLLEPVGPGAADRVEQGGWAAGEGLGHGEAGLGLGEVERAEVPVELAGAGG